MTPHVRFYNTHPSEPNVKVPIKSRNGDACWDIFTPEGFLLPPQGRARVKTGIRVRVPKGFVGLICPRSGTAHNYGISVTNGPGVIDANYTGDLTVLLINNGQEDVVFLVGQRIAQLLVIKDPQLEAKEYLDLEDFLSGDDGERGTAGFGSSGR